jgi:uncharacterized protein with LGFP repeats
MAGGLGFPTFSAARSDFGGYKTYQAFENGFIGLTYDGRTVIQNWQGQAIATVGYDGSAIHSTYVNTFNRNGGVTMLGYASNTVHPWGEGYTQDFSGGTGGTGAIMKSNANDESYWVGDDFWKTFLSVNGANGLLKYPTSDRYDVTGGARQDFQGGAILQSPSGTFTVYGAIGEKYLQVGAENSYLGFPTSDEIKMTNGWVKQTFEGGYILWKAGQPTTVYDTKASQSLPPESGQGSTGDWNVQYWNNKDLSGPLIWSATEPAGELRFAAGRGAPVGTQGIQEDNFSARWSTISYFEGGFYDFVSQADDGVRIYVDGIKIIDKWYAREPWSRRDGFVLIPKGSHTVVVEYFEEGGIAGQTLKWEQSNLQRGWTGALIPVGFDGAAINSTYVETYTRNGRTSVIGSPSNNVHVWGNGYTQDFSGGSDGGGAIMKSNANNNSYWVGGDFWKTFLNTGGADGILGYPTSDRYSVNGGWQQDFQGGAILSSSNGTFPAFGGVGYQYLHFEGGPRGRLGYPTSGEIGLGNGVIIQNFENGYVLYGNGPTRTVIDGKEIAVGYDGSGVNSTYTSTFDRVGGWDVVGSATNNVHVWGNGYTQDFSGGSDGGGAIMKSNANNNSYWVGGDFWKTFLNTGGADGILGYPTSDRYSTVGGALRQNFQGGAIYKISTGMLTVFGGIGRYYFTRTGGEEGRLGLPTSGEIRIGNSTIRQNFQKGYIIWNGSSATGYNFDGSLLFPPSTNSGDNTSSPSILLPPINLEVPIIGPGIQWQSSYFYRYPSRFELDPKVGSDTKWYEILNASVNNPQDWQAGRLEYATYAASLLGAYSAYSSDRDDGAEFLLNFLNKGGEKKFELSEALGESEGLMHVISKRTRQTVEEITNLVRIGWQSGDIRVGWQGAKDWWNYSNDEDMNWYLALGNFDYSYNIHFDWVPDSGVFPTFNTGSTTGTLNLTINLGLLDVYDFESAGNQSPMYRLHKTGLAKNFIVKGYFTQTDSYSFTV